MKKNTEKRQKKVRYEGNKAEEKAAPLTFYCFSPDSPILFCD